MVNNPLGQRPLATNGTQECSMVRSYGRTELAQQYFPKLCPEAAWHKLRQWITVNPVLSHLRELRRRTFTPAEVQLIYAELGEP
jgi:hypothetical protein